MSMKKRLILFVCSLFMLPVLSTGTVFAHDVTSSNSGNTTATETETETETEHGTTTTTLKERLEKRKTEFKVNLQAAEKTRIELKCKSAQGVITSVNKRSDSAGTARINAYTKLDTKLSGLITKVEAAGVDTTALKSEQTTLQTKITTFKTDLASYKQAVKDLADMDCKADPTAFKASLDSARDLREKLRTDVVDIRDYVKNTIKPTLQTVRKALADKKAADSTDDTTTGGTQ
jgi:hypothetical protein